MADDKSNGNGAVAALEFKNSVKKDEYSRNAGLFNYLIPAYGYNGREYVALPQYLPASNSGYIYHTLRDMTLMSTIEHEGVWSNAVNIATQKAASWGWEVTSEIGLRQKRAQELIQDFEWLGIADYTTAVSAHIKGYLLTGRAFIEIERATSSRFSKVVALHHLDPMSCMLTGNPRKPVNYMDTKGCIHELNDYDVGAFVMNPSPIERPYFYNSRPYQSATEAVYDQITQMEAIWRYLYEKTTGKRALSIDFITGISTKQMQDIVVSADADMERKNLMLYKGSLLVPIAQADAGVSHVRVDLAGLPDGFDFQNVYDNTIITYASALGLDVNDLDPRLAQRQSLGSGTQASLLDAKTQTKGLVIWRQQFTRFMQRLVLDDATSFSWRETSTEELTKEAEMKGKVITNVKTMIDAQIITNQQGLNILVDEEVLPREFLDVDLTQGNSIGDDEKDIAQPRDPNAPKPEKPNNGEGSEVIPQGTNTGEQQPASNEEDSKDKVASKESDEGVPKETKQAKLQAHSLVKSRLGEAKRLAEPVIKPSDEEDKTAVTTKHLAGRHRQDLHGNRGGVPTKRNSEYNIRQQVAKPKKVNEIRKNIRNISEYSEEKIDRFMKGFGNGSTSGLDIIDNAYSYTDEETGISAVVEGIFLYDSRGSVFITGALLDPDGEEVGQFRREIMGKENFVNHEVFVLDKSSQSSGFGKRFYQNQEEAYKKAGFKTITLQADKDVGGYAWARMGVDFDEPAMAQQFGEGFSTHYKEQYGTYPPVFPEHSWEIAAYKGPDGRSIGKEFMLGSNWNGVKNLSQDSVGYQIGQQYYGSK